MAEDSKPEKETAGSPKNIPERRSRGVSRGRRGRGGRPQHGPRTTGKAETPAEAGVEATTATAASAPEMEAMRPTSSDPDVGFAAPHDPEQESARTSAREEMEAEEPEIEGDTESEPEPQNLEESADRDRGEFREQAPRAQSGQNAPPMEQSTTERPASTPAGQQQQQFRQQHPQRQHQEQRQHGDRPRHFRDRPRQGSPAYQPPQPLPPPHQPATPATIQKAIEDVNRMIETLKETLDDMEEVLETLELAERQKTADEREVETLRRSLRHVQKPRETPVAGQPRH